jgi:hypothetical protein
VLATAALAAACLLLLVAALLVHPQAVAYPCAAVLAQYLAMLRYQAAR